MTEATAGFLSALYGYTSEDVHGKFKADEKEGEFVIQAVESAILYLLALRALGLR